MKSGTFFLASSVGVRRFGAGFGSSLDIRPVVVSYTPAVMDMNDEGWLRVTTQCPSCNRRDVLRAKWGLWAKPLGTYSLAGAQPKTVMAAAWRLRCTGEGCEWTGLGEPKSG
jgi:ribosomal protein L37AE/L43A